MTRKWDRPIRLTDLSAPGEIPYAEYGILCNAFFRPSRMAFQAEAFYCCACSQEGL